MNFGRKPRSLGWARKFVDAPNKRDHDTGALNRFNTRPPTGTSYLKGTPKNEPFSARHEIMKVVATWSDGAPQGPGDQDIDIRVYTPSTRLRVKIVLAYEGSDNAFDPADYLVGGVGPTWVVNAVSRNAESGRETLLKRAYPSDAAVLATTTLPDAYELDSAADILQATFTLNDGDMDPGAAATRVNLILNVTWEPNTEIPANELAYLYSLCAVTLNEARNMVKGIT